MALAPIEEGALHQAGCWSMLARYAHLTEDEIQQIKLAEAQDRSRAVMEKIRGRLTWNELLDIVHKKVSSCSQVLHARMELMALVFLECSPPADAHAEHCSQTAAFPSLHHGCTP